MIGYVGLGSMGGALAARLHEVLPSPLLVHDHDPAAEQRLTALGAEACRDVADLARRCDVIVLCLPTSDHVAAALFDEGGIAAAARPGTLVIDQTTGDPAATRLMAARLAATDVTLLDAPVSGGAQGAAAGTITIMLGAAEGEHPEAAELLRRISPNVHHAGGLGNGHLIKIVNNLLSCAQRVLSMEGIALAAKGGMDPATAVEILSSGGGRNAYLQNIMGPKVVQGDLHAGFTLGLAHKDVRLACAVGEQSGVPMFMAGLTRELYQMFIAEMGASAQVDTAALVIDRLAGTSVVPGSHRKDAS